MGRCALCGRMVTPESGMPDVSDGRQEWPKGSEYVVCDVCKSEGCVNEEKDDCYVLTSIGEQRLDLRLFGEE